MDIFYTIVISVAVIFLILILTYLGIVMSYTKPGYTYPPTKQDCPDYWVFDSSNNVCIVPSGSNSKNTSGIFNTANKSSLTSSTPGLSTNSVTGIASIDFTNSGWASKGVSAICAQKNWAIQNNILWDGVTNYNNC